MCIHPRSFAHPSSPRLKVIESAQWFAQGYFGRAWVGGLNATEFSTLAENSTTVSYITPMDTCVSLCSV